MTAMRLSELAAGYHVAGAGDPAICGMTEDSRRVEPGMLFVAVRGTVEDGHRHIPEALRRGAVAVVAERGDGTVDVPLVRVPDSRAALAALAARLFRHPADRLTLIGFTGTFGKTSTSAVLGALLDAMGSRTGVLGSLGARFGAFADPGRGLTTPAPVELHGALAALSTAGADTVVMEVTSHALLLQRVAGLRFAGGLISAIRPGEHSDFHGSYADYVAAKRRLLAHLDESATLAFDADNRAAASLAADSVVRVKAGFSLRGVAAATPLRNVALDHTGARFTIGGRPVRSSLLGRGNLENVALALTYALAAGGTLRQMRPVLRRLEPLPRRMERSAVDGRVVLDDTAGHPESLRATFEVADMLRRSPQVAAGARMIVVYALRGRRGEEINRRNGLALADLAAEHGAAALLVTAAADVAGAADRANDAEIDATRAALASRFQPYDWFDRLADAARAAIAGTRPGDLIVLVGAQGMNEGRRLLA